MAYQVSTQRIGRHAHDPRSPRQDSYIPDESAFNGSQVAALTKPKAFGAGAYSHGSRIAAWTYSLVVACCTLAYCRGLLMSVPSFPFFSHAIDDFNAKAKLGTRPPAKLESDWQKFIDRMLKSWDDITSQCEWIVFACAFVERHIQPVAGPSFAVATTFSYATYICGGAALVLCMTMKRHIEFIRRNQESLWNWHSVTEHNTESPFIATSALLAAPIAWRNWSYVFFGMFAISLLWCLLSSGNMSAHAEHAILDLRSKIPMPEVNAGLPSANAQGVPASTLARVLIIIISVIGLLHTAFVLVHFYQLGYPPPRATRTRAKKADSRSRPRHSEGSGYEEPEDHVSISSMA